MSSSNLDKVEQMEISEPTKMSSTVSTGFFVTKKALIIISSVFIVILVGAILATHFGTKSGQNDTIVTEKPIGKIKLYKKC